MKRKENRKRGDQAYRKKIIFTLEKREGKKEGKGVNKQK